MSLCAYVSSVCINKCMYVRYVCMCAVNLHMCAVNLHMYAVYLFMYALFTLCKSGCILLWVLSMLRIYEIMYSSFVLM